MIFGHFKNILELQNYCRKAHEITSKDHLKSFIKSMKPHINTVLLA